MTEGAFRKLVYEFTVFSKKLKKDRTEAIIRSLQYHQITDRESSILEAHKTTFEWALSQDKSNLAEWLSGGSGIYWISGKAGSGKSTLLKFLTGHQRTEKLLKEWAGGKTLVTASHFFWAQGTALQKTYQGLLQTMLCQVFQKYPDQVSVVAPTRWSSWTDIQMTKWSLSELSKCFQSMASTKHLRICLFVDGLDEYQGDHQELIEILESWSSSENIKICASSRPWVEFISAFGSGQWKLQVQDLTRQDIYNYSRDKLKRHKDIGSYGSEVDSIAQEISLRAQGVFLWVYLIVRSLIRGMRYMDTIDDLWERLNELPNDLEEFFRRMFDSIEPIYRKRTARALRVLSHIESGTTKSLITLCFMDLEIENTEYAFGSLRSPTPGQETEFYSRLEQEKKHQLVAQCRDLVHVSVNSNSSRHTSHPPWSISASFLHRTVADFLRTSDVHGLLVSRSGGDFDPRVSICRSYLAQLKIMSHIQEIKPASHVSRSPWGLFRRRVLIPTICSTALDIEGAQGRTERRILDALIPFFKLDASTHVSDSDSEMFFPVCPHLLNLAIRLGLSIYAKEFLEDQKGCQWSRWRKDALFAALMKPISVKTGVGFDMQNYDELNLDMARYILNLGASPNESADTANEYISPGSIQITIWSRILQQCLFEWRPSKY
ncbi:hypothetical protein V8F06_009639 [Rhypophila decipiens]